MNYTAGIIIVALIALGGYMFPRVQDYSGLGMATSDSTNFTQLGVEEFKVGSGCDDSGSYSTCAGSGIDLQVCGTAIWDPGVVASTSVSSKDVTVTGFTVGDVLTATLATTTQGFGLLVNASTTNVATVTMFQPDFDAAAINLATTTVKVCALSTS